MSVGGVFQLINNEGIQDKLIMATDKLRKKINQISSKKLKDMRKQYPGKTDKQLFKMNTSWMPTLAAIEKTHIVFINSSFKPFVSMAYEYSKTLPTGNKDLGNTLSFTMPVYGEFVNDAVVYIKLEGLAAINSQDKVKYIEMLGHRIFKSTKFSLGHTELDCYGAEKYNVHWQYKVPPGKETGWLRNIGQEVPNLGFLTADPTVDEVREYRYFGDGPQTFKTKQPKVEMWIPLLLWFKDIQTALPNFLFPYGQTNIDIQLENEENLIAYANNSMTGGQVYKPPVITDCALYLNHIYILPEIHKIFIAKFGFQLIRVTKLHESKGLQLASANILLHTLKWPVETMYVAFRPAINLTNSQRWHRNTIITPVSVAEAVVTGTSTIQVNSAVYYNEVPVVKSLELRAHDVIIYPCLPPAFYNSYMPYRFGPNLKAPRDLGWNMFNFNVNPGEYQPSGHFNISTERELYLNYSSDTDPNTLLPYIRKENPVNLIVLAECINFLLVQKNTAILKFST
jgi:hypothetical protein